MDLHRYCPTGNEWDWQSCNSWTYSFTPNLIIKIINIIILIIVTSMYLFCDDASYKRPLLPDSERVYGCLSTCVYCLCLSVRCS